MQQPLNYPYPQIYWVDSRAPSPWTPPGTVLPCPSSVPRRPGQRRPPPPPPPTPPLPPLPPLPLPPLKKSRDHSTGLCLLVMFFMILVALVALGLGMFQLFHLQKELAELREVSPVLAGARVLGWDSSVRRTASGCPSPRGPWSSLQSALQSFIPALEVDHLSHSMQQRTGGSQK